LKAQKHVNFARWPKLLPIPKSQHDAVLGTFRCFCDSSTIIFKFKSIRYTYRNISHTFVHGIFHTIYINFPMKNGVFLSTPFWKMTKSHRKITSLCRFFAQVKIITDLHKTIMLWGRQYIVLHQSQIRQCKVTATKKNLSSYILWTTMER